MGYIPLRFPSAPDLTYWGLVDTGAQVCVVSAGLANYLGLLAPDLSNVTATPFTVKGYNDVTTYMPALTTTMRLGSHGGPERLINVQMCVFSSNEYKILIGSDLLDKLQYIIDSRRSTLRLVHGDARFRLPIVKKEYVEKSRSWSEYHAAVPEGHVSNQEVRVEGVQIAEMLED